MQSTPNTPPCRPKIGRPPAEALPLPATEWEMPLAWTPRLLAFVLALALALTLALSHIITPAPGEFGSAPTLSKVEKPAPSAPGLVGALVPIQPVEPSEAYARNPKPLIDNAARQRLLSILSKD